jgi:hypothetical protein
MNEKIWALQVWLNVKGASPRLKEDGLPGPATRQGLIETFRNTNAEPISPFEIDRIALRLGCTTRQLATIADVESKGGGWDKTGLLKCLWERHYLWRRVRISIPILSDPTPGGYTTDADNDGVNDSWENLANASMRFGFAISAECASFGKFQVMGAHWKRLGYPSVAEMVWGLSRTEEAHYELLARFIEANGLKSALALGGPLKSSWTLFARGYNGAGQQGYDQRMADAYRSLA